MEMPHIKLRMFERKKKESECSIDTLSLTLVALNSNECQSDIWK